MPFAKQNIDLKTSNFPLLSSLRGRGVYVGGLDEDKEDKPKLYWAENVMPISEGFASAQYFKVVHENAMPVIDIVDAIPRTNVHLVYNALGEVTYLLENMNQLIIYKPKEGVWEVIETISDTGLQFSVFYLKGTTYYFHRDIGLKKFGNTFEAADIITVTLTGTGDFNGGASGNVYAMTSVLSYIVAVTRFEVYWSDPITETNFHPTVPSTSLAGSSKVLALKGEAKMILPITNGFIIYTSTNAVAASYSNNPNNPFIFREVANSAGTFNPFHVAYKTSLPMHFAWTDAGFMQVTPTESASIFPEITDFLGSDTLEFIDLSTGKIRKEVGVNIASKVTYLNSRYIAISYGKENEPYDYLLMFDTTLKRWGKLKYRHIAVFNFLPPNVKGGITYLASATIPYNDWLTLRYVDIIPKLSEGDFNVGSVALLAADYSVVKLEWLNNYGRGEGALIFSGVSLTRNRITEMNEVQLAGEHSQVNTTVRFRSELYNEAWKTAIYVPTFDWYVTGSSGVTHELLINGSFALASVVVKLSHNGLE